MKDEEYMKQAVSLAKKGSGWVNPNPLVGAVVVKGGEVIGEGYHEKYGGLHAEPKALEGCKRSPAGASIYVTLEPCSHQGKTSPCTQAIIKSGISRVVVGSLDPNPLVGGNGIRMLRRHGIEVVTGVLEKECTKLNQVFFHYIKTGLPFVMMKYAMTLDGKIATTTGQSKWITGEAARKNVHQTRHRLSAIMVGVGTILADDPLLTCRLENGKNPIRIICDTSMRTPLSSQVVETAKQVVTIIATAQEDVHIHQPYIKAGCQVMVIPKKENHIDLGFLMKELGEKKIDSILLEGGGHLNWSALNEQIVNKVQTYISPKMFGGDQAKTPIRGLGITSPNEAFFLKDTQICQIGEDFLIEGEVDYHVHRNY